MWEWPIAQSVKGLTVTLQSLASAGATPADPAAVLTLPDGTPATFGAVTFTDLGNVQAAGVVLSQAGLWVDVFTADGFSESTVRPVTHIDVYNLMVQALGLESEDLPPWKYYTLFSPLMTAMLSRFSSEVPSYDALTGFNASKFDTALAYLGAAWLSTALPASADATGEIASAGTGPDKVEFFRRSAAPTATSEELLIDHAWTCLLSIPAFQQEWDELADQPLFMAAGRRRYVRKSLGTSRNPLYSLYFDEIMGQDYGGNLYGLLVNGFNQT